MAGEKTGRKKLRKGGRAKATRSRAATGAPVKKKNMKKKSRNAGRARSAVALPALDASRSEHLPSPVPLGPYTVVRGRFVNNFVTSTVGDVVYLIGNHVRDSQFGTVNTPCVMIGGLTTGVPGTTEFLFDDPAMLAYSSSTVAGVVANASLHAVTVTIQCTSSATTASGICYIGALNQRINRRNFATYNALSSALQNRKELSSFSAYSLASAPAKYVSYPIDITEWSLQKPIAIDPAVSDISTSDTLAQIAIVLPLTSTAVNYTITVHTEWRVNFTDAVLASTAVKRPATPNNVWDHIQSTAQQATGLVEHGAHIAGSLGAMADAANKFSSYFSGIGSFTSNIAKLEGASSYAGMLGMLL